MNKMKWNIFALFFFMNFIAACSTLHTGPLLLGDIPLPFGRMKEGEVYKDSKKRFQVICPVEGAVINKGKYGVSFIYMDGFSNYGVFVYEPEGVSEYEFTLENVVLGIKAMLESQDVKIGVIREEYDEHRGHQALNFDFSVLKKDDFVDRIYVSRLVKTEHYIYWMNYSQARLFNAEPNLEVKHFTTAEKFFDGVEFEILGKF